PRAQYPREPVRRGGAGRRVPDLAGDRAPRLAQHVRDLYCAGHRERLVRHRGGGLAELPRPRGAARRALLGRHADRGDADDGAPAQEKPRYAGVLTWFDYGDPGRLDVHAESPLVVQQATAGVYSGLIQYDPDDPSKIVPDLAERWTVSPDGRTYTFHLRTGVKWHD